MNPEVWPQTVPTHSNDSQVDSTSRRSARAVSLPLQFREASSRIEIWTGSQDASPTGWPDPQAADFERSLLMETAFWVVEQCPIHALLLGSAGHPYHSRSGSGRLATLDDGRIPRKWVLNGDLMGEIGVEGVEERIC